MNEILLRDNRQVIPRWHTSRKAFRFQYLAEKFDNGFQIEVDDFQIEDSLDNWCKKKTNHNAIDLFIRLKRTSKVDLPVFKEVSKYLQRNYSSLTPTLQNVISSTLRYADRNETYATKHSEIYRIIGRLKRQVKLYADDALTWMDLAFYYTIIDESLKAEKSATIGFLLAPTHPFMASSYSRFLLHHNRPDEALSALKKTGLIKTHPLIASASLSIGAAFEVGKPNINIARKILKNYKGNPVLISDLAASLGTIEIQNGAIKKGKKLLNSSLLYPSENTIAQCNWLRHKHDIQISGVSSIAAKSLESQATDYYVNKQFAECSRTLMNLYSFQPFSEAPILDAGFLSVVGARDPQFVIDISDKRIPKHQMSFSELNNLIVAKLQLGQSNELLSDIHLLSGKLDNESSRLIGTFQATVGMFEIANGAIEDGCYSYELAIEQFKSNKDEQGLAIAQLFYAEQLLGIRGDKIPELLVSSIELAKKNKLYVIAERASKLKNAPYQKSETIKLESEHIYQNRFRIPKDII